MSSVLAAAGEHLLADFHGVAPAQLRDGRSLELLLRRAAAIGGAQVLSSHFHSFGDEDGITGVVILAESHLSIHTWPESEFAAIDIFMCGRADPLRTLEHLATVLEPVRQCVQRVRRGLAGPNANA